MRKLKQLTLGMLFAFLLVSRQSYKKVPYLQDTAFVNDAEQSIHQTGVKVMPKGLLMITVPCSTPELVAPFNLVRSKTAGGLEKKTVGQRTASFALQRYLIDNQGNINFPVLGEIHIGGSIKLEMENLIIDKLKVCLKEAPLAAVRTVNYRISVLGEITEPGSLVVSSEKINLLEALAMAGDLTVYGTRDNVGLIWTEQDNKQGIITMDLNKAETVLSPYHQLQQNDTIYVTPNKTKAKNPDVGTSTGL